MAAKWKVRESTGADGLAVWHIVRGDEQRGPFVTAKLAREAREQANEALGFVTRARREEKARAEQRAAARRSRLRQPTEGRS